MACGLPATRCQAFGMNKPINLTGRHVNFHPALMMVTVVARNCTCTVPDRNDVPPWPETAYIIARNDAGAGPGLATRPARRSVHICALLRMRGRCTSHPRYGKQFERQF